MRHPVFGRILTVFSLSTFLVLSFVVILTPTVNAQHLQKRHGEVAARQRIPPLRSGTATDTATSTSDTSTKTSPANSTPLSTDSTSSTRAPNLQTSPSTTPTSTTPTSTSTSSLPSTSSSSSSTSISSTPTKPIVAPTAKTTLVAPSETYSVSDGPTDTESPTSTAGAAGKGFFANKGAVAGVFSVLSLIGLGLLFAVGTYALRRRSERLRDQEEFLEKYPDHGIADDNISTHEITMQAPPDAYPDRQVHYGDDAIHSEEYHSQQSHGHGTTYDPPYDSAQYASRQQYAPQQEFVPPGYALGYPPGTEYDPAVHDQQYQYADYGAHPEAPPGSFRGAATGVGRESYQQSIDSYYGAQGGT